MTNTAKTKTGKILASMLIAGTMMATVACSPGGSDETETPAPNPVSASPSVEETAPTEEVTAQEASEATFPDGEPVTGTHDLKVKGPAQNESGEYLQITISEDDPALTYQPELVKPEIAAIFTAEEIAEAQKFAMTFAVEEYMDSVLNEGDEQLDEWLEANKNKISPTLMPALVSHAESGAHFVHRDTVAPAYADKVAVVYDKDSTRVVDYDLEVTNIRQDASDPASIVFDANYGFDMAGQYIESGQYTRINVDGTLTIAVTKDPSNPSQWLLSGIHGDYVGNPVS